MRDEDRKKVGRMLYERVKRAWKSGASGKGLVVLGASVCRGCPGEFNARVCGDWRCLLLCKAG